MATMQMTARRGSLQRRQYLSKAKKLFNYTGHEVSLPSYPSRLQRVRNRKFRNCQNNSLSWPTLPRPNLMPHSLLLGMVMCTNLAKSFGRTFTRFCKNFLRFLLEFSEILPKILQESWQDYCKIVGKNV